MITLHDNQVLHIEKHLAVKIGGEYEDTELVEVYNVNDPNKTSLWTYQAHYIMYGYHVGDDPPI
jgi:hypothetical protein